MQSMESFIECISCCQPISLPQLLEQNNDQKLQSLGVYYSLTSVTLKSFCNMSVWGMKHCWNLKDIILTGLNEADFYAFICSFPSIAEGWVFHRGENCYIENFQMENCEICQESFDAFCHCFETPCFKALHSLSIKSIENNRKHRMTDKQWITICEIMKKNQYHELDSLCLSGNAIGTAGIEAFVSLYQCGCLKKCRSLDLSYNQLNDKGIIALTSLFTNQDQTSCIERLDLSHNQIHHKGFHHFIMNITSFTFSRLVSLNISYNSLKEESIQALCNLFEQDHFPQLCSLNLSGIPMKGKAIESIASAIRNGSLRMIQKLIVEQCSFTQDSLQHLTRAILDYPLQLLDSLSLAKNHMNSQCFSELTPIFQKAILPSLTYLNINENKIGNEGIQSLCRKDLEEVCWQVQVLDFSENGIGNDGAFTIFDLIRHKQWKHLTDLNLEGNKISTVTAVQLRSLLEMENQLEILRLSDMTKQRLPSIKQTNYEDTRWNLSELAIADLTTLKEQECVSTPTACDCLLIRNNRIII